MKQLLTMIETVKKSGIFIVGVLDKAGSSKPIETKHFWEIIPDCQPFVFTIVGESPGHVDIIDKEGNLLHEKLDAPFKVFSIEMLNGYVTVPFMEDGEKPVYTNCILAYEQEPKTYAYYVFGSMGNTRRIFPVHLSSIGQLLLIKL